MFVCGGLLGGGVIGNGTSSEVDWFGQFTHTHITRDGGGGDGGNWGGGCEAQTT